MPEADMPDETTDAALRRLSEEVAGLRDLFQRRLLEDRARQRMYDELYEQLAFARKGLVDEYLAPMVREVLLVVDRVEASEQASEEGREVLATVRAELMEVLLRRGLRRVDALGEPFDPRLHEAVGRAAVQDGAEAGRVVEVRRPGYLLADRLIRPAQVVVGYAPEAGETGRREPEPSGTDRREAAGTSRTFSFTRPAARPEGGTT